MTPVIRFFKVVYDSSNITITPVDPPNVNLKALLSVDTAEALLAVDTLEQLLEI